MSDLVITASNIVQSSGTKNTLIAAETITAGAWLYAATATTVGLASNVSAVKAVVIGLALNGGVAGQPITYAMHDAVVAFGAILTAGAWYVVSAAGATSPVADQTSGDYSSLCGVGLTTSTMKIKLVVPGVVIA